MKAVLLGMNNPHGGQPRNALAPYPVGSAGWRLYRLLHGRLPHVLRRHYMNGFERCNLLESARWSQQAARAAALDFTSRWHGRTIVVLGQQPREALGLPPLLLHPLQRGGNYWRQLPHPSGRNLWYNDPQNRELAAALLAELYEEGLKS